MSSKRTAAHKIARGTGLLAALASVALIVAPAAGMASAPVKFGAKLNPTVQPSNSLPGLTCDQTATPGPACTMIQNEAYGRPDGGELAPKTGTIKKIRVIAGGPGSFKLQIAKVKRSTLFSTNEAKVVYTGPQDLLHGPGRSQLRRRQLQGRVLPGQRPGPEGPAARPARQHHLDDPLLLRRPQHPDLHTAARCPAAPSPRPADTDGCWILMEAVIK